MPRDHHLGIIGGCDRVLHAFRAAGGTTALVYARGDDGYPIPRQVYGSLGFRPHARTVTYRAPRLMSAAA